MRNQQRKHTDRGKQQQRRRRREGGCNQMTPAYKPVTDHTRVYDGGARWTQTAATRVQRVDPTTCVTYDALSRLSKPHPVPPTLLPPRICPPLSLPLLLPRKWLFLPLLLPTLLPPLPPLLSPLLLSSSLTFLPAIPSTRRPLIYAYGKWTVLTLR